MQMASARGNNLAPLGGSSFTFNNHMGDAEMADAPHLTPNFHDQRYDACIFPTDDILAMLSAAGTQQVQTLPGRYKIDL